MLSGYLSQEISVFRFLAETAATPPKVDLTAVIVAVVTAFGAVLVAYYQYSRRVVAENTADTAEKVREEANVSEAAMAHVAEKSLSLLEDMLKNEKRENEALKDLLNEANDRVGEKNATIERLSLQLQAKDAQIRELEYELHRLRGHLDSLLGRKGPTNA